MTWCARCNNSRWVCESHPDRPFIGALACTCGGAGIPCPTCNPFNGFAEPAPPDGFAVDAISNRDWD
jgi:hypothetical protein